MKILLVITSKFGGGVEVITLVIVTFLLGERVKFIYFLSAMTCDKMMNSVLKNAFTLPRPYMENEYIDSDSCSKEFGMPSGHSSAAWTFATLIFLDLFHGAPLSYLIKSNKSL